MQDAVIVAATRIAIGCFQRTLANIPAVALGACVIRALIAETRISPDMRARDPSASEVTSTAVLSPSQPLLTSAFSIAMTIARIRGCASIIQSYVLPRPSAKDLAISIQSWTTQQLKILCQRHINNSCIRSPFEYARRRVRAIRLKPLFNQSKDTHACAQD